MKFRLQLTLALLAAFAAFTALLPASSLTNRAGKVAAQGPEVMLDADVSNGGPCATIDREVTVKPGQPFQVGVCMQGLTEAVNGFWIDFIYDDTIINAPEVALEVGALDDNPDANAGNTTWGESLGDGWTCDILDLGAQPIGDNDPESGPGHGLAQIACWTITGTATIGDDEDTGVLGVVSFNGAPDKVGDTTIEVANVQLLKQSGSEMGTCNPAMSVPIPCRGATVHVAGETIPPNQWPTATPATGQISRVYSTPSAAELTAIAGGAGTSSAEGATPTPRATATVSPEKTAEASAAKENEENGGNNWLVPIVIGIVVALLVLGGGGAALASYLRRRGQPR